MAALWKRGDRDDHGGMSRSGNGVALTYERMHGVTIVTRPGALLLVVSGMARQRRSRTTRDILSSTVEAAFGRVLRRHRLDKGRTQADLEGETSIDRSYVSQMERGQKQACLKTIIHLARKLGMSPGALVDEVVREIDPRELEKLL